MNTRKSAPLLLLLVLALLFFSIRNCNRHRTLIKTNPSAVIPPSQTANPPAGEEGLNRHPSRINYTKHVRCRMGCRHIDEAEISEILRNGTINYRKSVLDGEPCRHKYAVEGNTSDNQRLRVIFAPCGDEMTVITCIDLDREWPCDCPGDHH